MIHATELIGAETFDSAGNLVGRVKEMFIVPDEQPNRVARLLLARGKYRPIVARYDQIASVAPGRGPPDYRRVGARTLSTRMRPGWRCKRISSTSRSSTPTAAR